MSLESPNLDDRNFEQLLQDARSRIQQACPEWTDRSPSDPGMVLLELFAHLTEVMIYRLNRVPEKAYIEFLRLIGVRLRPASAASVMLKFSRSGSTNQAVEIPRGARVTVSRSAGGEELPVFATARAATIPPHGTEVEVLAHHCFVVDGELVGRGSGNPGLSVRIQQPPIIAPIADHLDLVVGVEATRVEVGDDAPMLEYQGKAYRLWREVENFADPGPDRQVYVADRMQGVINFGPAVQVVEPGGDSAMVSAVLGEIPARDREIRIWYRRGGGANGNVADNTLTVLRDPIPGIEVTNPEAASGGRAAETLANALVRGPQELHSLNRAVTARDFELVALGSQMAERAKAYTRAELWMHANPGTVEVLIVPNLPDQIAAGKRIRAVQLREQETEAVRAQIQRTLDDRRPIGTTCTVNWAKYKTVVVNARIVVSIHEDRAAVRQRVLDRLHEVINPLPTALNPDGWAFGQSLRASHVYEIALAEPGVRWAEQPSFTVGEVPDEQVACLASDFFQPNTWYAGSASTVYRSLNNGESWEPVRTFLDEQAKRIATSPDYPGILAVSNVLPNGSGTRVYLSRDCGETWESTSYTLDFVVLDLEWARRDNQPLLLMATDQGLYELALRPESSPVQVLVDRQNPGRGFYAVTVSRDGHVALAAQSAGGVFISGDGGVSNTFRNIGRIGSDIRVLSVQYIGVRSFLWAGEAAAGRDDPGNGTYRWELRGGEDPVEGWQSFRDGWVGGSCLSLAFLGEVVLAATYRQGVLRLDPSAGRWRRLEITSGLPLIEGGPFEPVDTISANPQLSYVMAGIRTGVFRSEDQGERYSVCSNREFSDRVTLPQTWLFCSGDHEVEVISEDEADRY